MGYLQLIKEGTICQEKLKTEKRLRKKNPV